MAAAIRQLAIVLYPGVTALDVVGPYEILKSIPGVEVRFVAHAAGPILTDSRVLALGATHSFAQTPSPDLVLVPGSEANTLTAMADGQLLRWLRQAHLVSTVTASVCSGALILAAAGLLDGKPATTHWIAQSHLARFGAIACRDQRIVRSGKIWTAAGVSAGIDMALALMAELCGEEHARICQLLIEYDPMPPFDAGHPSKVDDALATKASQEMKRRARNPLNAISLPKLIWRRRVGGLLDRTKVHQAD